MKLVNLFGKAHVTTLSKHMSFYELVSYCFEKFNFVIIDSDNHLGEVAILNQLRSVLNQHGEIIVVRVSGEDIFYQVIKNG
jgi:hypothetical protein